MSKKSKKAKRHQKKSNPLARLDLVEFKNTVKNGHRDSLPEKFLLSKLVTPEVSIITEFTEEEKALMKESDSDTMVEFIISTSGIDRDGDTISVDGWNLTNFHKNPVVPWAHNYGQPPVARAINTRKEDGVLKSKSLFTGKELYPFGYMIGKMYEQKFLSAVSVGFNPSKFVFVEDSERKFGVDFIEQELLEYSAVPVPSNPEALIQARSKGIDITPMKEYLEELLDNTAGRNLEAMEKLIKVIDTKTITIGNVPDTKEDELYEIGDDETGESDSSAEDGDDIPLDNKDTSEDDNQDPDSLDSKETEEEILKNKVTVWMNEDGTIIEIDDSKGYENITLEDCAKCSKCLLSGVEKSENLVDLYSLLKSALSSKYGIKIFDFKYVDSKVLKNFPERFSFDEEKCLLIEKTQKDIDEEIIKTSKGLIELALHSIRKINPEYRYEECDDNKDLEINEEAFLEITDEVKGKNSKDNGDPENVINLENIDNIDDLKSLLSVSAEKSVKTTFNSVTGKLD